MEFSGLHNNRFYNNTLNNSYNVNNSIGESNYWNTTIGNFWAYPNGTGYSQTCADANTTGICDIPFNVTSSTSCPGCSGYNIDMLPLSGGYVAPSCIDADADGFSITGGTCGIIDCNDNNNSIYPNAIEHCNNVDYNCNEILNDPPCPSCVLTDAYWSKEQAQEREFVALVVTGQRCEGVTIRTRIGKNNSVSGQELDIPLLNYPIPANITNGTAIISWRTEYHLNNSDLGYYFLAHPVGRPRVNITSNNLLNVIKNNDSDQDGYDYADDCNDYNPRVHPDAQEICNCRDDDCNNLTDDNCIPPRIIQEGFDGATTNFTTLTNWCEVRDICLEKGINGKICFRQNITLEYHINFTEILKIDRNKLEFNTNNFTNLRVSSTLWLYNLNLTNPIILKDGLLCESYYCADKIFQNNTLSFTVSGFSVYEATDCGNSQCDSTETCSSCQIDCGICSSGSGGGGGGGGGGSGGGAQTPALFNSSNLKNILPFPEFKNISKKNISDAEENIIKDALGKNINFLYWVIVGVIIGLVIIIALLIILKREKWKAQRMENVGRGNILGVE